MYEHFTDRAWRAMIFANEEADRRSHAEIEPAHILAGILRVGECMASRILRGAGVAASQAFASVVYPVVVDARGMRTLSELSKLVITEAVELSQDDDRSLGTDHLLLAISYVDSGVGGFLSKAGLTSVEIRRQLRSVFGIADEAEVKGDSEDAFPFAPPRFGASFNWCQTSWVVGLEWDRIFQIQRGDERWSGNDVDSVRSNAGEDWFDVPLERVTNVYLRLLPLTLWIWWSRSVRQK